MCVTLKLLSDVISYMLYVICVCCSSSRSVSMIRDWDGLIDALEDNPDIREWVLQR